MNNLQLSITACLLLLAAHVVHAQDGGVDRRGAADAYDKGTAAYLAEDFSQAAAWFETAYRLAPASAALQQAIKAYMRANDQARAATLALELQERFADDEQAGQLADETLQETTPNLVRVDVNCDGCEIALDDKVQNKPSFFVAPGGSHTITGTFADGQTEKQFYAGDAGETVELMLPPPSRTAATPVTNEAAGGYGDYEQPAERSSDTFEPFSETSEADKADGKKLPPLVTYIGAGLTAVLGVATIVSGISANGKGTDYDKAVDNWKAGGCENMPSPNAECTDLYSTMQTRLEAGNSAETRTNVLLVSTLVVGAATGVIGLFFTNWEADKNVDVGLGVLPRGGAFGQMRVAF